MKKSTIATLIAFFLVIPATIYFGLKLPGRSYYLTGTAIVIELMVPFFMAFEGRKVQARELVLMAVMCALAIVSRVALPVPHFKPIFAVIMLTGIAFGPETGFMVGAISAFASNFFYGQGAFTPFQMFAYGTGGMLMGFLFAKRRLPRKGWLMAVFGAVTAAFLIGPLLDASSVFLIPARVSWDMAIAILAAGLYVNITQAVCTAMVLLLLGNPFLAILDRIKLKYGILEA